MNHILILLLMVAVMVGCREREMGESRHEEEVSLYDAHQGLMLPEEMQRELGLQLTAITDTNRIPESAIIRGAKEDFTYVKDGKFFVRTLLEDVAAGNEVVAQGVKSLWRIELLAIRGGEPCCAGN